jgi:hypothetical protein
MITVAHQAHFDYQHNILFNILMPLPSVIVIIALAYITEIGSLLHAVGELNAEVLCKLYCCIDLFSCV